AIDDDVVDIAGTYGRLRAREADHPADRRHRRGPGGGGGAVDLEARHTRPRDLPDADQVPYADAERGGRPDQARVEVDRQRPGVIHADVDRAPRDLPEDHPVAARHRAEVDIEAEVGVVAGRRDRQVLRRTDTR